MKKEIEVKKDEIHNISKEIEEKGEKQQVVLMKEVEQLKIDIATNKTRISSNQNEIQRVHQRKDQLGGSIAEIDEKIDELNKNKNAWQKEKEQSEKEIAHINDRVKKFKTKHKIDDANDMELDMDNLDKQAEDKQREVQDLREEQQNMLREKDKLELYLNSVDEKISKVVQVEKEHKSDIEKLKSKKEEFKKTTLELNELLNEDSELAAQLGNARQKLIAANDQLARLEARKGAVSQKLADSIAIKSILDSKDRFGKVYGTVSDLGQVSGKYSQALQVAAGARLKSIVVDSDKTAASCIKHLKQNKLGTATFLPLNKIRTQDKPFDNSLLKTNDVVGRAIDLIDYEPALKNAF